MNASIYRNTRFEIRIIQQGPNSFGLICAYRDGTGNAPGLEIPEGDFTDEEMSQVHAVLEMLEKKFAAVYDKLTTDPKFLLDEMDKIRKDAAAEKKRLEIELSRAQQGLRAPTLIKLG